MIDRNGYGTRMCLNLKVIASPLTGCLTTAMFSIAHRSRDPSEPSRLHSWPDSAGAVLLLAVVALAALLPKAALAQGARVLEGQVTDTETGVAIGGVEVRVSQFGIATSTDAGGYFRLEGVPGIRVRLRFEHLAYGVLRESVDAGTTDTFLQVRLTLGAIELEPVEVRVTARDGRRRGTNRNVVTREQIERSLGTSATLASALERFVTGVRIRDQQVMPGGPICVEFRSSRTLDNPNACRPPVIVMDGQRVSNPLQFFTAMPLEDIETLEVLPPGEAGVQYGTDSNRGVLLIETRTGVRDRAQRTIGPIARYDFAVEGVPYNWKRTFGAAFVGNAVGVLVAVAAARSCLTFDNLSDHLLDSTCGAAGTAGVRLALVTLPLGAVAVSSHLAGRTDRSSGKFWPTLLGAALIGAPGYFLSATGPDDAWRGADKVGVAFVLVGMPALATLADRLFRAPSSPAEDDALPPAMPGSP